MSDLLNSVKVVSTTKSKLEVPVLFWFDDMAEQFCNAYYSAFERGLVGSTATMPFTNDEWTEYVKALIALKIRKGTSSIYKFYNSPEMLNIPALLLLIIGKIGPVVYEEFGIRLVPMEGDASGKVSAWKIPSESELAKVSNGLEIVKRLTGIEISRGLPKDKSGDLAFMLTSAFDNTTLFGEKKTEDVLLALASIIPHRMKDIPRFHDGIDRISGVKSLTFML